MKHTLLLRLFLPALLAALLCVSAAQAASPRLEVLEVMDGYPAGASQPMGLLVHPPEGEGLLAPASLGGNGPELNLAFTRAPGFKLSEIQILAQPVEGRFHDLLPIKALLTVDSAVAAGEAVLETGFTFAVRPGQEQVFNFNWPVKVLAADQPAERVFSRETAELLQLADTVQPAVPEANPDTLADYSIGLLLLLVFCGGLALNLTPCVYPVIPITISYFVSQAGNSRRARLAGALAYWLGMVVMYSSLGLFAALGGGILGQALTHPLMIIALVLILLALAASMLGFWEIKMPGRLNQLAAANRRGLGGALLMGLSVGVLAAPCLGPFVLGLMTHVATTGSILYGIFLFLVLSLGLGLPLAVLAFFSGAISSLPGTGAWMVWVRKFFGIVLIIMAAYIAQPLLGETVFIILLVLAGLLGGIYLAWERSGGGRFVYLKKITGLLMALAALGFGCHNLELENFPSAQQPASPAVWQSYDERTVRAAAGKPVILDFTATWCQPCRQMERQTFPDPKVQDLLREFSCIKVDVTNGPPNQDAMRLINAWGIKGVPTFMFMDRRGRVMPQYTFVGYADADSLARHLQQVLGDADN